MMVPTLPDQALPQLHQHLCPQCHNAALQAVQIEIVPYRPAETVWLCANCLYSAVDTPVVGDGAPAL